MSCQHKGCIEHTQPITSFGGDVIGRLCRSGHAYPLEKSVRPSRCEICGCRLGHATGCDYLCEDALEQAELWADEGEWEESAAWIEYALAHNWRQPA